MKNSSGLRAVLPQPTAEFQLNSRPQINSSRLEFKQNSSINGAATTTNSLSNYRNIIHPLLMQANNNNIPSGSSPSPKSTGISSQPQPSRGFSSKQKNSNNVSKVDPSQELNNKNSFNRVALPETPKQPRILSVNSQYLSYQSQFQQQQHQGLLASQTPTMKPSQSAIFKKSSNLSNDFQLESSQNSHNLVLQTFQKPQHRKSSSQNIVMPLTSKSSTSPMLQHQIVNRIKELKPTASQDSGMTIFGSNQPSEGQKQYARNDKPSSARNSNNNSHSNKLMLSSVPQLPSAFFAAPKKNAPSLLGNFVTKVEKDDMMMNALQGSSPYLTGIQGTSTKSARIISTKISSSDLNKQQQSINLLNTNQSKGELREGMQQNDQQLQGLLRNTLMNSKQLKSNSNDSNNNQQQLYQQQQQQQHRSNRSSSSHANLTLKSNSMKSDTLLIKPNDQLMQHSTKNNLQQQQQNQLQQQPNQVQINSNGSISTGIQGSSQAFTGGFLEGSQQSTLSPKKHKKSASGFSLQSQSMKLEGGTVSRKIKSRATTKHVQPGEEEVQGSEVRSQNKGEFNKKEGEEDTKQQNYDSNNNFFSSKNSKEKQQNQAQNMQQTSSNNGFNKTQSVEARESSNTNQPSIAGGSQNENNDHMNGSQKITSTSQQSQQQSQPRIQTPSQAGRLQLSALVSSQKKDQLSPALAEKGDQIDEKDTTQSCESETSTSHNNNNGSSNKTNTKAHNIYNNTKPLKDTSTNEEVAQVLRQNGITQHPHTSYYIHGLRNAFKAPQSVDAFAQLYRQHFLQTCQGVLYSNLAKPANPRDLANKRVTLGPRNKKYSKTLVFDMDETLIHCNESTEVPSDVIVDIRFPTGEFIQAGINIRPFAREVLKWLSGEFEIIIFTASHVCYAQAVIDYLDPEKKYVHHRFFRDQCIQTPQGVYIKDLRIFQDRKLSEMVLIDNAAYSFSFQVDNGIPIIPFYDNKQDTELLHLVSYLRELHQAVDVREYNKTHLKMAVFNEPQGPQKVYDNLFKKAVVA